VTCSCLTCMTRARAWNARVLPSMRHALVVHQEGSCSAVLLLAYMAQLHWCCVITC
jgi:hypothetical protein